MTREPSQATLFPRRSADLRIGNFGESFSAAVPLKNRRLANPTWKVLDLDPSTYARHALHAEERIWIDKNCAIDIYIGIVHSLKLDPMAMLPFVLGLDFEGDQWTFFKTPHEEMRALYGINFQEVNVWRRPLDHAAEFLSAGKLITIESDSFWMPDTTGTDYRTRHQKSTVVINELDMEAGTLGYFHNAGYFRLGGEDFRQIFKLDEPADSGALPPFSEMIKLDRIVHRSPQELRVLSRDLLIKHLKRRPATNPVRRFAQRFNVDLADFRERGLAYYHLWAFGTIRQLGAAFECASLYLDWLTQLGEPGLQPAADAFLRVAQGNKTLILKAARAAHSTRPFDASALLEDIASEWDRGMAELDKRFG